jgi:hypothetical protein
MEDLRWSTCQTQSFVCYPKKAQLSKRHQLLQTVLQPVITRMYEREGSNLCASKKDLETIAKSVYHILLANYEN